MKRLVLVTTVLALLGLVVAAQAAPIQGSAAFNPFGNITTVNSHTFTFPQPGVVSGMLVQPGTGNFSIIPAIPPLSNATWLTSSTIDVNNPVGWTMGSAAFGTWVTTSGTKTTTSGVINLSLKGTFTPGSMFAGMTQNTGTMALAIQIDGQGKATNGNGTFALAPVPEPSGLLALAGGIGCLIPVLRRRH